MKCCVWRHITQTRSERIIHITLGKKKMCSLGFTFYDHKRKQFIIHGEAQINVSLNHLILTNKHAVNPTYLY